MRRLLHMGIAPLLALSAAGVSLVVTLTMVELIGNETARQLQSDIGHSLAELAYQTTDKLDRGMYERYREVQLMAERHELTDSRVPAATRRAVLDRMQDSYPYYAWIGLTDDAGNVLVSTKKMLEGVNVSKRPWYGAAYRQQHLTDVHEAVLLARLLPNPTGEPMRFFDVAFPYKNEDQQVAGVLGTHLSWQWAKDIEDSVLHPTARRRSVQTLILSQGKRVLLGPPELRDAALELSSLTAAGQHASGFAVEDWPDGKRYLVGYSKSQGHRAYPGLGWTVLVRQDLGLAYQPVRQLENKILAGGVLAAVLISLLLWSLARRITGPLCLITGHADALRLGTADSLPAFTSRLKEVSILERAINALVGKLRANEEGLREMNGTLEMRVTQRTHDLNVAVEQTRNGERRVRAIIDSALDAFVGIDGAGRITDWNPRAEQIFGWTRAEALGRDVGATIIPERLRAAHAQGMARFASAGTSGVVGQRLQMSALRRNGEQFPIEMTIGQIDAGHAHFFGAFIQDISERTRIQDELARERELVQANERLLRTITDNLPVLIAYIDRDERYRFANATYEAWFGVPPASMLGRTVKEVLGAAQYADEQEALQRNLGGEPVRFESQACGPTGTRHVEVVGIPDIQDGVTLGAYVLTTDISAARQHQEELSRLARIDTLTGLPNRRSYNERLTEALQRIRRSGSGLALMYLDIDHFKQINDTLGHAGGDIVLQEFGERLRGAVRSTDVVSRLAGDEFTIILEGLNEIGEAGIVAQKIIAMFAAPVAVQDRSWQVSTSIGVAFVRGNAMSESELAQAADGALYRAKANGRGRFALQDTR